MSDGSDLLLAERESDGDSAARPSLVLTRAWRAAALVYVMVLGAMLVSAWLMSEVWEAATIRSWPGLLGITIPVAALMAAGVFFYVRRLAEEHETALGQIHDVVDRLQAGDLTARTHLMGESPIARLGISVDNMLDLRGAAMLKQATASDELNQSVIEIMRAVGDIATTKDLAIKVPVSEDVTGAIADALNVLNEETARVLASVSRVSSQVGQATLSVRSQSESAAAAAGRERHEVELAAGELGRAAAVLHEIADRARACNQLADQAVRTTVESVNRVNDTTGGVNESRELIRETEKRIKRLGERSQEIGQIVSLIQDMAEQTGILALNASMHAIAAGEAGRNFVTVADQVKRLSESAKDASGDIARLVIAIQTETSETVLAMNQAISKVVEISQLAENAGRQMRHSQETTESLASSVREIARTSVEQAKVGAGLQERARIIQEASTETARQLTSQAIEIRRLTEYAKALVDEVSVFKLPVPGSEETR